MFCVEGGGCLNGELPSMEQQIGILLHFNADLVRRYNPALRDFKDEEIEALDDEKYYRLLRPAFRAHLRAIRGRD